MNTKLFREPISDYHDTKSFTCGAGKRVRELNDFLHLHGRNPLKGETFVWVSERGSSEIVAYHTIFPSPTRVLEIPSNEEIEVSSVWLWALAVAEKHQHKGVGSQVVGGVIRHTLQMADRHPEIESLSLRTLDATTKSWYLHLDYGFQELAPGSEYLVLPVSTIRLALAEG